MVFLPNPPEADKSLCLPCGMFIPLNAKPIQLGRSLLLWGYAQKIIHQRRINPRNIKNMPAIIFFAGLDLEQKSSFIIEHWLEKFVLEFRIHMIG